jgi:hypothetical protein
MRHATLAPLLLLLLLQLLLLLFGLFVHLQCYPTALPLLLLVWAFQVAPAVTLLLLLMLSSLYQQHLRLMLRLPLLLLPRVRQLLPGAKPAKHAPNAAYHPGAAPTLAGQH